MLIPQGKRPSFTPKHTEISVLYTAPSPCPRLAIRSLNLRMQ